MSKYILYILSMSLSLGAYSQTQPYSYIVKKVSGIVYAYASSNTGLTTIKAKSISTVLNVAINSLSNGGTIYIARSINDTVTTPIISQKRSNISIIAEPGAILITATKLNQPLFRVSSVSNWVISGIEMNGNDNNQSSPIPGSLSIIPSAILVENCKNVVVKENAIHDFRNTSIWVEGNSSYCYVEHNKIYNIGNGWNGITFGTTTYCFATYNEVYNYGGLGISSYGKFNTISYNIVHDVIKGHGQQAIAIEGGGNTSVDHNICYNVGTGVFQSGAADVTADAYTAPYGSNSITNNTVNGWVDALGNSFFGGIIVMGFSNTIISNNTVKDSLHLKGIWLINSSYNVIHGNNVTALHYGVYIDGTSSLNVSSLNNIYCLDRYGTSFVVRGSSNVLSADNITRATNKLEDYGINTKNGLAN